MPAGASRRASAFPIAVLVLLLAARVADVLWGGQARQVPFTVALFVLPLLYATPAVQPLLARHRPLVLISQGLLTWVPFAVFGGSWQIGIGGLLAGLVLLMLAAPLSWVLAGGLVVAEVGVRAGLAGLPAQPGWLGGVAVVVFYVNDGLLFFAMVRLAQCVGEVDHARAAAAGLAVAGERLSSAQELQAAIGEGLSSIAAIAAAAQRELPGDAARAREGIAAAGAAARDAIAQAREVTARQRGGGGSEPALVQPRGAVIANRLAWAVLIAVLLAFVIENVSVVVTARYGARLEGFAIADIVVVMVLQLYHSRAIRVDRRPRAWPVTLGLQAVLVYASFFPFVAAYVGALAGFVAGSALLLVPGRWRWAGFAAVTVSWPVLSVTLPARGWPPPFGLHVADTLYLAAATALSGLVAYGLARFASLASQLEALRRTLARMAVVQERLRIARDVHDLLGLGLSAVALKADLIGRLIGRDDSAAAAEIEELSRICASARADIWRVTADSQRLSLTEELATAGKILSAAGVRVQTESPDVPLPVVADDVLAPVLREAVTNVLRHSRAATCEIEAVHVTGGLRLRVSNDGVPERASGNGHPGSGLANLTARVHAVGGRLASREADGAFELVAEVPLATSER